jgi:hypothetical protein
MARKSSLPTKALDPVAPVLGLVGDAFGEVDHRGNAKGARDVGDVETLDMPRGPRTARASRPSSVRVGQRVVRPQRITDELAGPLDRAAKGKNEIPQLGRPFVILLFRRHLHVAFELLEPLPRFALEKNAALADPDGICLRGQDVGVPVDLGPGIVIELPASLREAGRRAVGKEDAEFQPHLREGLAQKPGMGKGAEIKRLLILPKTHETEAGKRIFDIHPDEKKALIVGEVGVVFGFPFLDQAPFEEEGLALALHLDRLDIGDEVEHRPDLWLLPELTARRLKISRDPAFQVLRLAHVKDPAEAVLHEVDARPIREAADFLF